MTGLHMKNTPRTKVLTKTLITTILYVCLNIVGCGLNNYFVELLWESNFSNKILQKQNFVAVNVLLFL